MTPAEEAAALLRFRTRQSVPLRCVDCGRKTKDRAIRCAEHRAAWEWAQAQEVARLAELEEAQATAKRKNRNKRQRAYHKRTKPARHAYQADYYARNRERLLAKANARNAAARAARAAAGIVVRPPKSLTPKERRAIREVYRHALAHGRRMAVAELARRFNTSWDTAERTVRDLVPDRVARPSRAGVRRAA